MKKKEYDIYNHLFPSTEQSLALEIANSPCKPKFACKELIWGNGNVDARLMIIGKDSAGADEKEQLWKGSRLTQIPLTNKKTGAKMRILLKKADIDPYSVFITNVVKCNVGYRGNQVLDYDMGGKGRSS